MSQDTSFEPDEDDVWVTDFDPLPTGENQVDEGASPYLAAPPDQMDGMSKPTRTSYSKLKLMKGSGKAYRMNAAAKDRACDAYARSGQLWIAAAAAGVSVETIRQHRKTDEVFEEAMEAARGEFCASLEMEAHRRAFVGVLEPVIGRVGKDEDGVITYVRKYSDRLTEMLLKRHMPEQYVERMQIDQQVSGGVLVVGRSMTLDQWEQAYGGPRPQPTLPILEQFRAELGMAPSNPNVHAPGPDGLVNVTPSRENP